jgi:ABC-2 type transport system permease protein
MTDGPVETGAPGPATVSAAPLRASGPGGNIYDLGYQGYDGPRLGRGAAFRALFWHTVRACYGIGRGGRAKIAPLVLGAIALLPAIIAVGIAALAKQAGQLGEVVEQASPINYASYFSIVSTFVILFCAIQAPELLGRDQRHGVLPLYFSRALARLDYAVAKVLGLGASLLILILLPYLVLFVGRILVADSPIDGLTRELPSLGPLLAQAVLTAGLLGALSMVISAFTPRRAYATVGIIAAVIIPTIVAALLAEEVLGSAGSAIVLLSPGDVLDGANAALFGSSPDSPILREAGLPGVAYIVSAVIGILVAVGLTIRRYLRIAA